MEVGSWDIGTEAPRARKMGGAPMGRKMGYGIWDIGTEAPRARKIEDRNQAAWKRRGRLRAQRTALKGRHGFREEVASNWSW